jgi:hypothetical protein
MLYGAGSNRSEDWWKGLGNVLLGEGFLASQSKTVGGIGIRSHLGQQLYEAILVRWHSCNACRRCTLLYRYVWGCRCIFCETS